MADIRLGLSYDDVLLVPKKSTVYSRKDISLSTKLTRNININIPVISANMDTVTEEKMAIAMARAGGIGILHQFMLCDEQADMIRRIKRSEGLMIENPYTISEKSTVHDVNLFIKEHGRAGLIVVNDDARVLGIITARDLLFEADNGRSVTEIMTPLKDLIYEKPGISTEEAKQILKKNRIEKLPLLDNDRRIAGLITSRDIERHSKFPQSATDDKKRLLVGAAVGVKDYMIRVPKLIEAGVDVIVVDVAHGHSVYALDALKAIKKEFDIDVIAGNIATREAAEELISAGADALKVGIGPGGTCKTRIVAGSGVPQITAIMDSYEIANEHGIPLIADGGIRNSGDVAKAIGAGSSSVMIGTLLAGTEESPGRFITKNGMRYKLVRGMASFTAAEARKQRQGQEKHRDVTPEGVEALVPYRGYVSEFLNDMMGGLRSGISYSGFKELRGFIGKGDFIRITPAGMKESRPHDISEL